MPTEPIDQHSDRDLLASIVESSQDAVIGKTLEGLVTSWNKAAEGMFGYPATEIIGRPIVMLFPPELADEEPMILQRVRRGERIEHYETVRLHRNGRRLDVSLTVSPIRNGTGQVIGASKIVRDITEQKALRVRLAEVQSQLLHVSRLNDMGQLASAFAHELNQPLSAVSAYIGGARRLIETGDTERAIEGCDRAAAQVAWAGEVYAGCVRFVSKGDGHRRAEDLGQAIDEAASLLLVDAQRAGMQIEECGSARTRAWPSSIRCRSNRCWSVSSLAQRRRGAMAGRSRSSVFAVTTRRLDERASRSRSPTMDQVFPKRCWRACFNRSRRPR